MASPGSLWWTDRALTKSQILLMIQFPSDTPIVSGVKLTQKDIERFSSFVDTEGPIPSHCPEIGPCWLWKGPLSRYGYGRFTGGPKGGRRRMPAHRVSCAVQHGGLIDNLCACHKCDNPACVRPDHLFPGTDHDNIKDMVSKKRHQFGDRHYLKRHPEKSCKGDKNGARIHKERMPRGDDHYSRRLPELMPRGSKHVNSKLTEDGVREIRRCHAAGESQDHIAFRFGIAQTGVSKIVRRLIWRHVE